MHLEEVLLAIRDKDITDFIGESQDTMVSRVRDAQKRVVTARHNIYQIEDALGKAKLEVQARLYINGNPGRNDKERSFLEQTELNNDASYQNLSQALLLAKREYDEAQGELDLANTELRVALTKMRFYTAWLDYACDTAPEKSW